MDDNVSQFIDGMGRYEGSDGDIFEFNLIPEIAKYNEIIGESGKVFNEAIELYLKFWKRKEYKKKHKEYQKMKNIADNYLNMNIKSSDELWCVYQRMERVLKRKAQFEERYKRNLPIVNIDRGRFSEIYGIEVVPACDSLTIGETRYSRKDKLIRAIEDIEDLSFNDLLKKRVVALAEVSTSISPSPILICQPEYEAFHHGVPLALVSR